MSTSMQLLCVRRRCCDRWRRRVARRAVGARDHLRRQRRSRSRCRRYSAKWPAWRPTRRGHVFVYARTGHAVATLGDERTFYHGGSRLFQFDQTGKFVKEIGQGVYAINFAQQVRVDPQDNVWIVDAGSNQVVKFDADGRFQLVLGRKPENISVRPGARRAGERRHAGRRRGRRPRRRGGGGEGGGGRGGGGAPGAGINGDSFNRPSDVTWDRAGNIYVADGFGANNRIAKFTKDGNFVKTWGQTGSARASSTRSAASPADAAGNLYVADAGNNRIQVFDGEGTFKSQITNVGTPQAHLHLGRRRRSISTARTRTIPRAWTTARSTRCSSTGEVVGKFGKAGKHAERVRHGERASTAGPRTICWVGEVWNWRAQKVTLRR